MAATNEPKKHPLAQAYHALKREGLLRGNHLADRVEIDGSYVRHGGGVMGGVAAVLALMRMGVFDDVDVWDCQATGRVIVERETDATKRRRLAGALGGGGLSYQDGDEYAAAIEAAGGYEAVAKAIMDMGRERG